ncbi:MAG: dNTP triphosphohydrolase, partial [Planctomycetes bacterium]|nr:dNTP triphosphohydrolase [Planctomycetota bacterium]
MPLNDRAKLEHLEEQHLAPYALRAAKSRGRRYPEPEHDYRTCFQRDRDRIIHSEAFRRLEYKTQVFLNWEGDHFRTRLTHTIEVAQCARTIARALSLNEEVCEAVALAHDLGHTPFGHAGEHAMRDCMEGHGGYEHNGQSLRIVDFLERRYAGFPGLNLTHESRYGMMKHETDYDKPLFATLEARESPSLEAQVVNFADEISYNSHDAEDGLYSGILTVDVACESALFAEAVKNANDTGAGAEASLLRYYIVRYLKNVQVSDLLQHTSLRLEEEKIKTLDDVLHYKGKRLVSFSPEMSHKVA